MLRAGAARVDVTPDDLGRTFLAGFGINRRPKGVLDRLEAVALWLGDGPTSVALVAVDCIGLTRPFVDGVRGRLSGFLDRRAVICCATHTHSGPDTLGLWGRGPFGVVPIPTSSGVDPKYQEALSEKLARAVEQARALARPARLRVATFDTPSDWSRNDRASGGRFDAATAFALDDESGERIATVLNWAAHPETLWEDNPYVSPDYPGHFRSRMRGLAGGEALFFSGPLGAMLTPNLPRWQPFAERVKYIERLGADLAQLTHGELAKVEAVEVARFAHRWQRVSLPNRNKGYSIARWLGIVSYDWDEGAVQCEVHRLELGPLTVLTVPGEPAPEVGRRLLSVVPEGPRALFALAVDEIGYVLTEEQRADPEYKYERRVSLGSGTAERIEAALQSLNPRPLSPEGGEGQGEGRGDAR